MVDTRLYNLFLRWLTLAATTLFCLTASAVRGQSGGKSFEISSTTATGIALASAAQYQVLSDQQWKDYEDVIVITALNGVNKMAANSGQAMTSTDYGNIASLVRTQLDANAPSAAQFQNQDEAARLRYGIDSLSSLAASTQAGSLLPKVLFEFEKAKFTQLETALDPSRQTPADLALYAVKINALQFVADQVQQASDLAYNDAQFAAGLNPIIRDLTAFDTTNSYAQIQNSYTSGLPTLPSANSDGSYALNEHDLVSQYQSVIATAQAALDSALAALESKSTVSPRVGFRPLANSSPSNCLNGKPPDKNMGGVCWNDLQGGVTAISKLVGFSDSKLGTQIATVGSAAISAGTAIAQLASGTLTGFATAGPVGAIIGAAVSIFSLFEDSGSNPNAAVLQQILKLSQQVARMQADMDAQFAKVDATLNTILNTLNQNFALINYNLGVLNGNVRQIQNALLDVEAQLNQMEQYNLAYQQAQEADTLMLSVNGCLNYRATHNNQDIGNSLFGTCQNTFFTWAQTNALDAIWAPQPSNYTDAEIYNFFEDFSNSGVCPDGCPTPFAVDINYLSQFPAQNLGLSALSTVTLPNPDEWTLGARAYLLMGNQWPQYAAGLNTSYLSQLIQIGTNLQRAARNINSNRSSAGTITQNSALFNGLESEYANAITKLQTAIQEPGGLIDNYERGPSNLYNSAYNSRIDIWGGVTQTVPYKPAAFSAANIQACNGVPGSYVMVPNLISVVSPVLRLFEQLGLGTVNLCLNISIDRDATLIYDVDHWDWYNWYTYQVQAQVNGNLVYAQSVYGLAPDFNLADPTSCIDEIWSTGACQNSNGAYWQAHTITTSPLGFGCQTMGSAVASGTLLFPLLPNGAFLAFASQNPSLYLCKPITSTPLGYNFVGNAMQTYDPTSQLNNIYVQIGQTLEADQQTVYGQIANNLSSTTATIPAVLSAAKLLTGTKTLLQAYANFGLPNSLQTNDTLHSALYGNQAIYDAAGVQADFARFSTGAISDATYNQIMHEMAGMNTRLTSLTNAIGTALTSVQTNQFPESLSQIDVTLEDLQALVNLQNASALTPCSFRLSPGFAFLGASGGSGTIAIQELNGCNWRASTNAAWVTVTNGMSGAGSGTVTYSVVANTSTALRDAIFVVGDQVFRVTQTGQGGPAPGCTYALDHSMQNFSSSGGSDTLSVSTGSGCAWTAVPSASWISISSAPSGSGSGAVNYSISANSTTQSQTGTITVAGQTLTIDQAAAEPGCIIGLSHSTQLYMAVGGTDTVAVSATSGCSWTATSNASWITISGGSPGTGNGTFQYVVSPDTTAQPRTETITIGSQTEMVTQIGIPLHFVPITPCRVADTRHPDDPFGGPSLSGGIARDFVIPDSPCGIPSTAQAYSLNVTVVPSGPLGYVTVWPSGEPQPRISTLNSLNGRIKANAAIVPAGSDGAISVFATNDTNLVLDIDGYFEADSTASDLAFYPLTPCRVADTRKLEESFGAPYLAGGQPRTFPILSSVCNVPSTAQAYSLNFTAVPHGPLGYLTTWPTGESQPKVSTLNALTGAITANAAIVPAGTNGSIDVFVTNDTDLVIDINGYFAPPGTGGLSLYNLTPCRVLDTRKPAGSQPFSGVMDVNVATSACAVPAATQSYVLNATVVPPGLFGYLTLWPQDQPQPLVSTLNSLDGMITSNMAIVPTTNGLIDAFASNPAHLVLDISGYFAP